MESKPRTILWYNSRVSSYAITMLQEKSVLYKHKNYGFLTKLCHIYVILALKFLSVLKMAAIL